MEQELRDIWPAVLDARFEPERLIARGGFATIVCARRRADGLACAVKILHPEHLRDVQVRQRFMQEAEVVQKLDHPNVVHLEEFGTDDTHAWMILRFVEGDSLKSRLSLGTLPWREAARCGREIASAMVAIHAAGVVHRDLKPENVLIDREGRTMLTDFGMSKPRRSGVNTGAGVILGTPGYLAPEAVKESPVSPASDMYSLGIVLWECVAGFRPFERTSASDPKSARTRMEELMAAREMDAPRLGAVADVPRSLDGLVARLLERAPADRPPADQVLEELAWIESGAHSELPRGDAGLSTIRVTRPGAQTRAPDDQSGSLRRTGLVTGPTVRARRWPAWAIGLAALVAVNVALGLWLALKR